MGFTEEATSRSSSTIASNLDELPYFTEKYPGKICCLCNLCERSALGQGDILKISINIDTLKAYLKTQTESMKNSMDDIDGFIDRFGRKKGMVKSKVTINNEVINELDIVGHGDIPSVENLTPDECFLYVHSMCGMWCLQIKRIEEDFVPKFEEMIVKSLLRKCSFCLRYGASINCRMSCQNNFHLPCAAASGCFLVIESFQAFCVEHVNQVPYIAVDTNIECRHCFNLGDISKLLMCSTCGAHYHTNCVGLANFPDSRSGWNCQQCCKCIICRQSESSENRSVKCEQCQKLYHTNCLRPIISSVPKYGWKCNRCRICSDCKARTPGAGASSRWHCHYTICDSCYQQRNKGFSCPICHKAYRAASHKEMVKCNNCNRFVHSGCDGEADLNVYHIKKEKNPDYDYICPPCKSGKNLMALCATDPLALTDGFPRDLESEFFDKDALDFSNTVDPLKISKKRMSGFKEMGRGGKVGKGGILTQINRKRSSVRGKGRPLLMLNSSSQSMSNTDSSNTQCSEDDMSLDKKIILCSAKDKFILMQDICVTCGALGTDQEACLIPCVQCGQCYHPHCANVTLSKTMLQKGWRCLDCTVCEGCGQKNDEARLILCDECDISMHIYCMSPPLDSVPNGNWKCKLCCVCQKCGRNSPGKNSHWFNGFLECGPCASQSKCFVCSHSYNENELIIQCSACERWSHCLCDNIKNEDEAKHFNETDYQCKACRKDNNQTKALGAKSLIGEKESMSNKPQTVTQQSSNVASQENATNINSNAMAAITNDTADSTDNTFCIDGVCVSEHGFNMIRSLTTEIKKKRKLKSDLHHKDAGIMSAIDSVVSGGNSMANLGDGSGIDGNMTPVEKLPAVNYKDGMVWLGEDGSQPEGFSISTNEEGVNILRKKRQRNLQKLGIGGFNVRMRGIRKESEELYMGTLENPSLTDEKKKKIIKKKLKSKLCESYPSYLQEAFFGKPLLDNKASISFAESDSSDDVGKNQMESSTILLPTQVIKTEIGVSPHTSTQKPMDSTAAEVTDPTDFYQQSTSMHVGASLLTSNSSHLDDKQLKIITSNNADNNGVNKNGAENQFNMSNNPNLGLNPIKMEIGQYNPPVGKTTPGSKVQPNSNQIAQNNFMQSNINAASNNGQKIQQQQKLLQYQSYETMGMTTKNPTQYLTQKSEDPMLSQVKIERDMILSQTVNPSERMVTEPVEMPMQIEEPVKEAAVAGTQKTAEKMRKDEDLGEMATISAVLYANTQHPELKHLYPNWNERCKQILKKWRSLSTEMKAPFLQQAKDNRSVLRLRRTQQEPEKMYFQQKSLKEQEQERVWKQHQAKNKETYCSKFSKNPFGGDFVRSETITTVNQPHQQQQQPLFDMNVLNENSQNKLPKSILHSADQMNTINPNLITDTSKSLAHVEHPQQSHFMTTTLNQQQIQPQQPSQQPSMDDLSKAFVDSNKSEPALHLPERNDIFLSDKTWTAGVGGVSKLPDPKDSITGGVEKLEADENAGFNDILGGFGEGDDDDILKSLTAEIGDDFNILEYADPELDEINGSQNLLNKLDFDENQKTI